MELVFFYVNQSSSKFIEKKGFNFSPNYNFYVEYTEGKYVLKQRECKTKLPKGFFDEKLCIMNITAIVGENGSGKTTLLNRLSNYNGSVKDQDHNKEYEDFFNERYEKDKIISIYLEESELICYHNIENLQNKTGIRSSYLYQDSVELMQIVRDSTGFENISKICLSNSMYALEDGVSTNQSISKISLNVNSLKTLKGIFYQKKCRKVSSCAGGYYAFQDILCHSKKVNEFQQILDILYLRYISNNDIESILANNIHNTLEIKFQTFRKCLDDKFNDFTSEANKDLSLRLHYDLLVNELLADFDFNLLKVDIFAVIYMNLLFEMITYLRFDKYIGRPSITNKKELVDYVANLIKELLEKKSGYANFFDEAFQEIKEYEQVLHNCEMFPCSLPISDSGYVSYKQVKYGSNEYEKFLSVVEKSVFDREYSYVLKYIDIGGLRLASGERALLNFFSWIHLVPYFNYISNDVQESLHDNILLLIDEIDLYCHPLWQQKLVYYLIEEVKAQFSEKKVQIIFTTHSPVVLSDIPHSNIIYLKRENEKCIIDEDNKHSETFGANIYKLFNDAFFLGGKGQIGEFSKKKIQEIIDKIKPETKNGGEIIYPDLKKEEVSILEQQISLIGEKILRDKLYEMLYKCKYSSLELREKKIKIYEEKIKRLQNGEDI
ncbi:MAG: AAA family ATPase [Clostridiales bacterium]|nr:AAA family ATPase [Clostridiales bacterium]